jgi:hypothetical protein
LKGVVAVLIRGRAEGVTASASARDVDEAGVTRPLEYGVYRAECDGVTCPEEYEGVTGVMRPPPEEATLEGRDITLIPTVGAESFAAATNTPHLGGHTK